MLTKQRHVLERLLPHEADTKMVFVRDVPDEPYLCVEMRKGDWVDMGSPDEITLSVEPGNTLDTEA